MIGVKVMYTRGAISRGLGRIRRLPSAASVILAEAVKKRVQKSGDTAGQPVPQYDSEGVRLVSPRYPLPAPRTGRSGVKIFDSSADFHAATRRGSYDVSGGMWNGLAVLVTGRGAKIVFRGRSEGQEPVFRQLKAGLVARGRKVSNALKAATVLGSHGVNVLALSAREFEAVQDAARLAVAKLAPTIGTARVDYASQVANALAVAMARRLLA